MNIAIDGPAGAGKSTIAKLVAKKTNSIYVDTGAMYRAMALYFLKNGMDPEDKEAIVASLDGVNISIRYISGEQHVFLNGEDVTAYLREEEVGNMASGTSVIPEVRKKLVALQKKMAEENDVVMDGRDIGTVVLPNAELKIYLTASAHTRAERRYKELLEKGDPEAKEAGALERIEKDIEERDHRDMTREESPLQKADDAVLVDSSDLTIDQVVDRIMELYQKVRG